MSQAAFANAIGISAMRVSRVLKGDRPVAAQSTRHGRGHVLGVQLRVEQLRKLKHKLA